MIPTENWPVSPKVQAMSNTELARAVFEAADDTRRENMGVPNEQLVEAARRLLELTENNMTKRKTQTIGTIGNYYGCLEVKSEDDKFFWAIENHDGHNWEEIPKSLYDALVEFDESC